MSWLLCFSIGFFLACAGYGAFQAGAWCLWAAAACAVPAALLGFACREKGRRAAVCLLGCFLGLLWCYGYDGILLSPVREADGKIQDVEMELCDYPRKTKYGGSVTGYLRLDGKRYKTLLYLREFPEDAEPGNKLSLRAELRVTTEGGAQEPTYHRTEGIYLLAYPESEAVLHKGEKIPARYYPARWRKWVGGQVERCFPENVQGFVQALLLGDKSNLAQADRDNLSLTGLSHLVAVSGLHVSILFGVIQLLTRKRRVLTAAVGIPAVLLFAAIVGFTPSITRAAIMECLIMLGLLLNREYDPPTALGFSGLVILLWNPLTICSAGFQLSFASVAGIFLFYDRINGFLQSKLKPVARKGRSLRRRFRWFLTRNISICLSASVLTYPFLARYFGAVSLVAPLANLLCLWVVGLVFYLAAGAVLAGGVLLPVGKILGAVAAWGVRYILGAARLLSRFPLCAVYTDSVYIVLWLIFAYLLFGLFLLRRKAPWIFAGAVALGLCLSLLASWAEPLLDDCRVTALNVCQGQCIILEAGRQTFVVDCGSSDNVDPGEAAARYLLSMGIGRIDGLILTHLDTDHTSGAGRLLSRVPADFVALPAGQNREAQEALEEAAAGTECILVSQDMSLDFPGGKLRIFAPVSPGEGNAGGLAVLLTAENCDTLITGDLPSAQERLLLERENLPEVDILVAGHHGADNATSMELLERTSPEIALISVGENSFGQPAEETLWKLLAFGCKIYRTDQQGTILIRR